MSKPKRIQLSRKRGWRKPEGAVVVSRPSIWGNPFQPQQLFDLGYTLSERQAREECVHAYRDWLCNPHTQMRWVGFESDKARQNILTFIYELRGKDLCCWCSLSEPCHADVLLEIANR